MHMNNLERLLGFFAIFAFLALSCSGGGSSSSSSSTDISGVVESYIEINSFSDEMIDFEGIVPGTIVDEVFANGGTGSGPIGVFGTNPDLDNKFDSEPNNAAVVFDSSNPPGIDFDLGTPNENFGGPGTGSGGESGSYQNTEALGNILIINEADKFVDRISDGVIDNSDSPVELTDDADNLNSPITFDFSVIGPVTVKSIDIIDVEAEEPEATVEFFDNVISPIGSPIVLPKTGDNGVATVNLGPTGGVTIMKVTLNGSGAIDNIVFERQEGCLTRTPGFWGNRPEITEQFLPIESAGLTVDNVDFATPGSAIEDMCFSGNDFKDNDTSPQQLQLIRQCTAAALNIAATLVGEGNCMASIPNLSSLMSRCCHDLANSGATGSEISNSGCIEDLDDFNNLRDTMSPFGPFERPGPADPETCKEANGNGFVNPDRTLGPK